MAEDFEFGATDDPVLVDGNIIASRDIFNGCLADYVCRTALEEFSRDNDVSDNSREMIQVLLNFQVNNPCIDQCKFALMKLVCQLSDGESHGCRYSAETESDETILESAVYSLKAIANSLSDNLKSEAAKVAALIKFQAVFVCCRNEDLLVAKKIFSRVWCIDNFEAERKYYAILQTVLDSECDIEQVMSIGSEYAYAATLKKVKEFLKKVPLVQEEPFFCKEAKRELEDLRRKQSLHGTTRKLRAKHNDRMLTPSALKTAVERLFIDPKKLHPRQNEVRTVMGRINGLRKRYSKENQNHVSSPAKNKHTDDIIVPKEGGADHQKRNPTHNGKSPLDTSLETEKSSDSDADMEDGTTNRSNRNNTNQYRRNINRENRHEPVASPPDKDHTEEFACPVVPDLGRRHRLRESLKPPSPSTSTASAAKGAASPSGSSKRRWTEEEEDSLYLGVKSCGVGKWAAIKSTQSLNRTGVNIKDKWRNMLKSGDVKRLEKKYGTIP